jgi:hypothetical protein
MAVNLGLIASQISGHLNVSAFNESDYESIATISLSGNSSTISFTSIPSTYTHLQLRFSAKTDRNDQNGYGTIRFNNDSGTNYSWHAIVGDGSTTGRGGGINASDAGSLAFGGSLNSAFGVGVIDILNYSSNNKHKTLKFLNGYEYNSGGEVTLYSGNWRNTATIDTISFIKGYNVNNWVSGSRFELYGIKG